MCATFCHFLGNWELLGDLLSHLSWLIASVQHGDANIALANYRRFKNNVSEQVNSNLVFHPPPEIVSHICYGNREEFGNGASKFHVIIDQSNCTPKMLMEG